MHFNALSFGTLLGDTIEGPFFRDTNRMNGFNCCNSEPSLNFKYLYDFFVLIYAF